MALRIGILAAEASGDLLGAGLMQGVLACRPDAVFEGVGGERMRAAGLDSWVPMERLSVMGLVEVLRHLPGLLRLRRELAQRWLRDPPDLFIGVDAPDFNLGLEQRLRAAGIPTAHYVSPTVWAWRPGRVKALRRAVDLLLGIFPFEVEFLRRHGVPVTYVGHPLARELPMQPDRAAARAALGLPSRGPVLALLPGSRCSEVEVLSRPFLATALRCRDVLPELAVVVPLINERTRQAFEACRAEVAPDLAVTVAPQGSRAALAAADVVLTASGTATLEALLSKRPMVVGYKVHWLTYALARGLRLVKVPHVAMANLLAGERLAPELLQGDCVPERLAPAVLGFFQDPQRVAAIANRYRAIHADMQLDTNREAARAVLALLGDVDA
jgi:lipid-A-disaccharide synthase